MFPRTGCVLEGWGCHDGALRPVKSLWQQLFSKTPTWFLQPCSVISFPSSPSTDPSALCSPSLPDFHFLPCLQITLFISKVIAEEQGRERGGFSW